MEKYSTYLSERKYLSLNEYEIDIYKEIYWKKMLGDTIYEKVLTYQKNINDYLSGRTFDIETLEGKRLISGWI